MDSDGAADAPRFRRSHPVRAFVIMTLPFIVLIALAAIPLVGFVILLVLMPIEMGRIGGRRIARGDAVWVAMPAALVVGTLELAVILTILATIPGVTVVVDLLGLLVIALIYGCNGFFFSVGALSTAFDPKEAVDPGSLKRSSA
jgi:hypothetical protein